MRILDIIAHKRDGLKLSKEEMILNENGIPKTDYFFIDGEIYV